jgi:hypothetical protein
VDAGSVLGLRKVRTAFLEHLSAAEASCRRGKAGCRSSGALGVSRCEIAGCPGANRRTEAGGLSGNTCGQRPVTCGSSTVCRGWLMTCDFFDDFNAASPLFAGDDEDDDDFDDEDEFEDDDEENEDEEDDEEEPETWQVRDGSCLARL